MKSIEDIRKTLMELDSQGYTVNHLVDLVDFVEEKHHSFKKNKYRNYIIFFLISILLASFFLISTYPLAINYGNNAILHFPIRELNIFSGYPLEWLKINYAKVDNIWVIQSFSISSITSLTLDFLIYSTGLFLLFTSLNKIFFILKHRN